MAVFRHRPGSARCPMKMYAIFARYRADHDRRWRTSRAMVGAVFWGGCQAGRLQAEDSVIFFLCSSLVLSVFIITFVDIALMKKTGLLWKNGMYGL